MAKITPEDEAMPAFVKKDKERKMLEEYPLLEQKLAEAVEANKTFTGIMQVLMDYLKVDKLGVHHVQGLLEDIKLMKNALENPKFTYKLVSLDPTATDKADKLEMYLNEGYEIVTIQPTVVKETLKEVHSTDYLLRKRN
jgi:hypothetical protein